MTERANLPKDRDAKPRIYCSCYDGRATEVDPRARELAVSPCLSRVDGGIWAIIVPGQPFDDSAGDDGDDELEGSTVEPLMTVTDVAKYLKVTPRTVYSFLESGALKGMKIGRSWRIRRSELERLGKETAAVNDVVSSGVAYAAPAAKQRLTMESPDFADCESSDLLRLLEMIRSNRSLQRYKRVFDSLPCATLVVDSAGHVVDSNEAASRLFGLSAAAMASRKVGDLPGMALITEIESVIETAYRQGSCSAAPSHADVETDGVRVRGIWAFSSGSDEVTVQICCDGSVHGSSLKMQA